MFRHLRQELEIREKNQYSTTENGAIGYGTSNSALLDLNFAVSSLRNSSEEEILDLFDKAFLESPTYTTKWLFFARDIREGLGERRLFRICYKRLLELDSNLFYLNLKNISEYGRWDDLTSLLGLSNASDKKILEIIKYQLSQDLKDYFYGKPISLLAKWLPSENASSQSTKSLAKKIRKSLNMTSKEYRKTLSKLRKHLNVVEIKMCNNDWDQIDYEKVPSLANLKYKEAFMKHDSERRMKFFADLDKGTKTMNMKVATPIDIVSRYKVQKWGNDEYDITLENAWKNLKDISIEDTLVVADGSGSMLVSVNNNTRAIDVANALAIYTSEHNKGVYKGTYITFSSTPRFVDLNTEDNLYGKIKKSLKYNEISNTDIYKVFMLILDVAVYYKIPENEMIKNILIISDMEFDRAQSGPGLSQPLFEQIKQTYSSMGYALPKLIFWNVNSRTKTIPLIENELGVILVSGFSQNVLKMVMSNKYDPYQVLIEMLDRPRYDQIIS